MKTLLVLGSKPDPALPPRESYDQLACANGSGFSAAQQGLPVPAYTVMSVILTAVASGKQTLKVIAGLRTKGLYCFPRPQVSTGLVGKTVHFLKTIRMQPFVLKWRLRSVGYHYDQFMAPPHDYYAGLVRNLCDGDPQIMALVERKQPSTGIIALLIGIACDEYDRFILTGFSFELTHAYGRNPEIDQRGTSSSKHADTDVAVIRYLCNKYGNIYTTEPTVHARAEVPLLAQSRA